MKNLFLLLILCIKSSSLFSQSNKNNFTDSNGLKQKTWINYHNNGKVRVYSNYKNDTLNGKYKTFFTNGKIEFECNFKMGIKDGVILYYNKDGTLRLKGVRKNGKNLLYVKYWRGKEGYKEIFKNDTVIERWFNGKKLNGKNIYPTVKDTTP